MTDSKTLRYVSWGISYLINLSILYECCIHHTASLLHYKTVTYQWLWWWWQQKSAIFHLQCITKICRLNLFIMKLQQIETYLVEKCWNKKDKDVCMSLGETSGKHRLIEMPVTQWPSNKSTIRTAMGKHVYTHAYDCNIVVHDMLFNLKWILISVFCWATWHFQNYCR